MMTPQMANVSVALGLRLMHNLLALDQASKTTGWAVYKDNKLVEFGHFTFEDVDIGVRLNKIRDKVAELIMDYDIDFVAFEDIYMDGQRVNNVQTFKVLAEVFGVIYELITDLEIEHEAVLAGTWKSTLGIKGADRPAQKRNAQKWVITNYEAKPTQDECDAICIGAHILKKNENILNWDD